MPIIKVWCLPKNVTEERLQILCNAIIATVENIPELGLAGKDAVTVLFPSDRMEWGLGEEIITEVTTLVRVAWTDEVRAKLAEKIGILLHGYFPSAKVECFIDPRERSFGFWRIDPRAKTEKPVVADKKTSNEPMNISGLLNRMRSDAAKIHEILMAAPANLTGREEPALHEILIQIEALLDKAEVVWPSQPQPTEVQNG